MEIIGGRDGVIDKSIPRRNFDPVQGGLALVVVTGFHDIVRRTGPRNVIVTACGPVVGDFLAATLNNCSSFCVSLHLRSASLREFYFILLSFFFFPAWA